MCFGSAAEHDIDVCHAEICVNDQHAASSHAERDREVDRQIRLADAPLAARHGDDACTEIAGRHLLRHIVLLVPRHPRFRSDHLPKPRCLICHVIPSVKQPRAPLALPARYHLVRSAPS